MEPRERLDLVVVRLKMALPGCRVYTLRVEQDFELHVEQGGRELVGFRLPLDHEYLATTEGAAELRALVLDRCFQQLKPE